jgi:protein-L-isoaspartate(D-aspartate) O-methyltransferase
MTFAPYDRILVTCGAPEIPKELVSQLKNGGILVVPVGDGPKQKMIQLKKDMEGNITQKDFGTFKFVPMLERKVN